jgi:glutaredoxin
MDFFKRIAGSMTPPEENAGPSTAKADVVLYCTQWCPGCRAAREFLKRHNVRYVEVDIHKDRDAAARVRGWANGNETTPTFDIRGMIVVDWDPQRVAELLDIQ